MLVYVTISPMGVHEARLEAQMDEEEAAKDFYRRLKPLLEELSRTVALKDTSLSH